MKKEQIQELFKQFENICYLYEGVECWSARELQQLLGYSKWENFEKVIEKAKQSCSNAGELCVTINDTTSFEIRQLLISILFTNA